MWRILEKSALWDESLDDCLDTCIVQQSDFKEIAMRWICSKSIRLLGRRPSQAPNEAPLHDTEAAPPPPYLDEVEAAPPPLYLDEVEATTLSPHLDDLDLRNAILGEGVVLEEEADGGGFVLYAVDAGYVSEIGRFGAAAGAWRAVDALDDARKASAFRWRARPSESSSERLLAR
jgi:hypothetical protein